MSHDLVEHAVSAGALRGATSVAEETLARASWQQVLLTERPRRRELLRLKPSWDLAERSISVHRNLPFEFVTAVWDPFLAFAGIQVATDLSGYDDSLGWTGQAEGADLELVCVDFERYADRSEPERLLTWFLERVTTLSRRSSRPVLVTNWPSPDAEAQHFNRLLAAAVEAAPSVFLCDVDQVRAELGAAFFDHRAAAVTSTTWSAAAFVGIARELGLRCLPALLTPPLKALALDLDGTLYDGVLGEEGAAGVRLTDGHRQLQEALVALHDSGTFLSVVSRNTPEDVEDLFALRHDFPLKRNMLSVVCASWKAKSASIAEVARTLRIDTGAVVLLDDNPGELLQAREAHPTLRTLHALDAAASARALAYCPGLWRTSWTREDSLRTRDIQAAAEREAALRESAGPAEYLAALQVTLTIACGDEADVARAAQLSARTNQFNTSLLRLDERSIAEAVTSGSAVLAVVELSDRLSDSGAVAFLLARHDGERLLVEEVSISCRALGRGVETALIESALLRLVTPGTCEIAFRVARGPRNGPALEWVEGYCGSLDEDVAVVPWSSARAQASLAALPLTITTRGVA